MGSADGTEVKVGRVDGVTVGEFSKVGSIVVGTLDGKYDGRFVIGALVGRLVGAFVGHVLHTLKYC